MLSVLPPEIKSLKTSNNFPNLLDEEMADEVDYVPSKKKKKIKGFDGESPEITPEQSRRMMPLNSIQGACFLPLTRICLKRTDWLADLSTHAEPLFTIGRTMKTIPREDGGAETHVEVKCTLADIARATNLRIDDAAFALSECGLLTRRITTGQKRTAEEAELGQEQSSVSENDTILITRAFVDQVMAQRNVKMMYMIPDCVIAD